MCGCCEFISIHLSADFMCVHGIDVNRVATLQQVLNCLVCVLLTVASVGEPLVTMLHHPRCEWNNFCSGGQVTNVSRKHAKYTA